MTLAIAAALLVLALLATLRAVTASSTERLLWGSLISSIGLGLAVQLRGGGYYGLLMVAVFIITDIMLYLFFRSLKLLPDRAVRNANSDRLIRTFFLWISLCSVAGILMLAFAPTDDAVWVAPVAAGIGLLNGRVWGDDWLLVALPVLGLVILVTGGFFLVRREHD